MATTSDGASYIRQKVVYRGHVQGVGFRYTTQGIARNFAVAGYVKNLRDGSVELVVEGDAPVVDDFLSAVAKRFHGHISGSETEMVTAGEIFNGFGIRH